MNRIPAFAPSLPSIRTKPLQHPIAEPQSDFVLPIDAPHRVYLPSSFTPSYDYPLVLWLHSNQSSEMELAPVMEHLSQQNYIAVAPRANVRVHSSKRLYRWGSSKSDYAFAEDVAWECILAALECLPVNPSRIFIAGFGDGGSLAQWIGLQYPERLAGIVSLSGPAPTQSGALTSWKLAKELPVLFMQRKGSTICSHADLQLAMRLAHRSSLNYTFWQLHSESDIADEADELSTSMLGAANRFMMGIVTNSEISLDPQPNRDHMVGPFGIN